MDFSPPHARDLRKGRCSEIGRAYLLTTVTFKRAPLFRDLYAGRILVQALREQSALAETLAFVVMPDHLHWLVVLRQGSLDGLMQRLKSRSALRINQRRQMPGPVWQRGFHDRALREEEDLRAAARYVVANPLRKGLVATIGDYPLWDAAWM